MKVLVLYDSQFGNTERLAQAMATALEGSHDVELRKLGVGGLELAGFDLVLVGGPTQGHGPSLPLELALRLASRRSASAVRVATFDTRFRMARIRTGSAAAWGAKKLKRRGARLVVPPESFFVTRTKVPALEPGELERAAVWATTVTAGV
jgi:flavodoxin